MPHDYNLLEASVLDDAKEVVGKALHGEIRVALGLRQPVAAQIVEDQASPLYSVHLVVPDVGPETRAVHEDNARARPGRSRLLDKKPGAVRKVEHLAAFPAARPVSLARLGVVAPTPLQHRTLCHHARPDSDGRAGERDQPFTSRHRLQRRDGARATGRAS
jgi:hypothetical protein